MIPGKEAGCRYGGGVVGSEISDEELGRHWHDIVVHAAQLQRLLDQDIEAAGLPAQWFPVLDLLLRTTDHRLPMSTLAREVAMTSGGFSKLADRMALEGLIDRRGTTDDRRVVHATLTDEGLRVARRLRSVYLTALRTRVLATVKDEELAAAAATLTTLATAHLVDPDELPEQVVASERDPALPDRRGRGRTSGSPAH